MKTIYYIDRSTGEKIHEVPPNSKLLSFLYSSYAGKITLEALFKRKFLSEWAGRYMNKKRSKKKIESFIRENKMDLSDYIIPENGYSTFNEFFYRKIKPEKRPIGEGVVSPADGKILAFEKIEDTKTFNVKGIEFDLRRFLMDDQLVDEFIGATMVIIRLAPTDYHRFHFACEGVVSKTCTIKGWLYSVSPIALKKSFEIFCHNKREFNIIQNEKLGKMIHCDVGATMVGSIFQTFTPDTFVQKGSEKGYFAFGGSTIVLLFEKGKVKIAEDILKNTKDGFETSVLMGENIAD